MNTPALIKKVVQEAKSLASHSWEYGAVSQALLELQNPELSVFAINSTNSTSLLTNVEGLEYAKKFIRTTDDTLVDGTGIVNGNVGDKHDRLMQTNRLGWRSSLTRRACSAPWSG
jgi:hypothetical protein